MSFLIIDNERFPLDNGEHVLGGEGKNAVPAPALRPLRPTAVITIAAGSPARIRALDTHGLTIDGTALGREPRELAHGARLELGDLRLAYGELGLVGRTSPAEPSLREATPNPFDNVQPNEPTADTGGRVTDLRTQRMYDVPRDGLRIGRDPSCHIVLASRVVSREHALIAPSLLGYMLTDRSLNGVHVNGVRVQGGQLLYQGDWFRVGDVEFRFEADPTTFEPQLDAGAMQPPQVNANTAPTRSAPAPLNHHKEPPTAELPPSKHLLATMEVLNGGPMKGMRFRIERTSVQIGRGVHNDVRILDESVSASHATLFESDAQWHLVDHDSKNGTYVEGRRVVKTTVIGAAVELRFGNIKLLFRPIMRGSQEVKTTRRIVG